MEADLDRTEILKPAQNELFGENLLHNEYSADVAKLHKRRSGSDFLSDSVVLSRPTTPHHLRQSTHFQNRPPHANGNNIATNSSTNISESTNNNNKISQAADKQKQVKESDNKKQAQNSPNKTITTTNPVKHSTDFVNLNNSTMATVNSKQVDSPKIKQKTTTTTTTAQSANKAANSTATNTKSLLGRSNSMERRLPPSSPSSRHVNGSTNPVQHSTISNRQYDSQAFERPDSARDKNNGDAENAAFFLYSKTNQQQQQPKTSDQSIVFPRNSSASNINYASINSNGNSVSNSFTPKYSTFEPRASSASSSKSRNSSSNSGAANMSEMNSTRKLNGKPTIN